MLAGVESAAVRNGKDSEPKGKLNAHAGHFNIKNNVLLYNLPFKNLKELEKKIVTVDQFWGQMYPQSKVYPHTHSSHPSNSLRVISLLSQNHPNLFSCQRLTPQTSSNAAVADPQEIMKSTTVRTVINQN